MKRLMVSIGLVFFLLFPIQGTYSQGNAELNAVYVNADLSKPNLDADFWKTVKSQLVPLSAQPIAIPRPKTTQTEAIQVQVVHNGQWIAFRLTWKDTEKSEGGPLGKFSDAVAMEFPVKFQGDTPPSAFMGEPGKPVHIYHWRAQYQQDQEKGFHAMKDIYPQMSVDMYPLEFKDMGHIGNITDKQRMVFVPGQSAGNPQSFKKSHAVDEILAEGFGTSAVAKNSESSGLGRWAHGQWSVVIVRPLQSKNGSVLDVGKDSFIGFAVWQGGKGEVGSRKSVTLGWIPLRLMNRK